MALTKEFVEAVSQGNKLRVKIMLKDSLLVDTTFAQFNEMMNYAETRLSVWVNDSEDDEAFSQSPEELDVILAGLVNNFSKRRVTHLKGMISKMYQPKPKLQHKLREKAIVIKKTREVVTECNGIISAEKQIIEACSRISNGKQIDTNDVEQLRVAATRIVAHCDKITRK